MVIIIIAIVVIALSQAINTETDSQGDEVLQSIQKGDFHYEALIKTQQINFDLSGFYSGRLFTADCQAIRPVVADQTRPG